ncbi:MAG TPA: hypothetical protein VIL35_10395 [Vicinamibacterales bacterium]
MKAACSCHSAPELCATGVIERPCYYPGQLLTPAEMTLEQQYFRDKLRRHNRLLHGWGVVCGAVVCLVPDEQTRDSRRHVPHGPPGEASADEPAPTAPKRWKVRVTPGYILGPYGDEILIDREQIVDLRTSGRTGATGEHGDSPDPWCADVYVPREPGPLYVAVRYRELRTRPVRVQPAGCGCDEAQCEYSRCRDGYEIGVLTECPSSHDRPQDVADLLRGPIPDCPECPHDPWVALARVDVDAEGVITEIDNCVCRRMVVSFATAWWRCSGDACAIRRVEVEGGRRVEPGRDVVVRVETYDVPAAVKVSLGEKVTVAAAEVLEGGRQLAVKAKVEADAAPGPRTLEIRDATTDRLIAASRDALVVTAPTPRPEPPAGERPTTPGKSRGRGRTGGGTS